MKEKMEIGEEMQNGYNYRFKTAGRRRGTEILG